MSQINLLKLIGENIELFEFLFVNNNDAPDAVILFLENDNRLLIDCEKCILFKYEKPAKVPLKLTEIMDFVMADGFCSCELKGITQKELWAAFIEFDYYQSIL